MDCNSFFLQLFLNHFTDGFYCLFFLCITFLLYFIILVSCQNNIWGSTGLFFYFLLNKHACIFLCPLRIAYATNINLENPILFWTQALFPRKREGSGLIEKGKMHFRKMLSAHGTHPLFSNVSVYKGNIEVDPVLLLPPSPLGEGLNAPLVSLASTMTSCAHVDYFALGHSRLM